MCIRDRHINCEVQLGHASGSPQSGRKVQLSWAGRLSPDNTFISNGNGGNSGEWTSQSQAVYDLQNSIFRLKQRGWYPFAITGVGSAPNTDFPITVPTSAGAFTTVTSRYIKLSDFVNSAESASSFKQGAILDIVVGRDLDPLSDDLGGIDLRVASIKIRFCPLSAG